MPLLMVHALDDRSPVMHAALHCVLTFCVVCSQGAGAFLQPQADAAPAESAAAAEKLADRLLKLRCFAEYTAHLFGSRDYPLECDAAALPLPFPALPVSSLQRMLAAQHADEALPSLLLPPTRPEAVRIDATAPPVAIVDPPRGNSTSTPAVAAAPLSVRAVPEQDGAANSTSAQLSQDTWPLGASAPMLPGSSCPSGQALCRPDQHSAISVRQLNSSFGLLQDAACYAQLAQMAVAAGLDTLPLRLAPHAVLAAVRFVQSAVLVVMHCERATTEVS